MGDLDLCGCGGVGARLETIAFVNLLVIGKTDKGFALLTVGRTDACVGDAAIIAVFFLDRRFRRALTAIIAIITIIDTTNIMTKYSHQLEEEG